MKLSEFDYVLPEERIAQTKMQPASASRLLIENHGKLSDKHFYDLPGVLEKGDVLVINETKVATAILKGRKTTGGPVELLLERRIDENTFQARIKGKRPRIGIGVDLDDQMSAQVIAQEDDAFHIRFSRPLTDAWIKEFGALPTPPYIKKNIPEEDYQTRFASRIGSVAAPTAGLHFTDDLLKEIADKGVEIVRICLHITAGTFLPIRIEDFTKHKMHPEQVFISKEAADKINNRTGRIFIVGTTTLKSLESAADEQGRIHPYNEESNLFIYPGYKFRTKPDGFITNFHLPKSSLLLLVSAFAGKERVLNAYRHAIENKYRFYSLGDAMLFLE
ncbi:tRNA preQ1(34) S-adenosylmethionine ribosyltransferase-isomerase QueA [Candidatus Woesearchaeota archaeon]|nr:tRNA preQ1(34) S-adenosylmethionine ribosyltransferase-isomerase QueA [Candidatus Woesearchaeota archaeon]